METNTGTTFCSTRTRGRVHVEASRQLGVLYVQLIRVAELISHGSSEPYEIRAKISIEHTSTCKSEQRCSCQVETVKCSRFPVFNSKVSFEVQTLDCDTRLMVKILICDSITRRQTVIGCASFSVRSIVVDNKTVRGWYYLFKEEELQSLKLDISTSEILRRNLPAQSETQFWLDPKCFTSRVFFVHQPELLNKVQFHSCRPPTVSEVSGASLLKRGDVIFSLNDMDVLSYRGSSLHHVIKSINIIYRVEVLREVLPTCAKYEFCHIDKPQCKGEVQWKKRETAEKSIVGCLKVQQTNEDQINSVGDPDETKTVSCGNSSKTSILKNILRCMGDMATIDSVSTIYDL